jgi:hypothetical protein
VATGVQLEAIAGSWEHGTARRVEATEYRTRSGRRSVSISAFLREEREGMLIGDGAMVSAPASDFRRNVKADTAALTPPAPFTGSATLKPGRAGKGVWEGDLQLASLRGGAPIVFTGPEFSGRVYQEQPFDERPSARLPAAARRVEPPLSVGIVELSHTSVRFHFHQGPFLVYVEMLGPGNRISLNVVRRGTSATYATKPHFEGNRVRARFGRLGSLDLTFTPTPGKVRRCGTIVEAKGVYAGRLEFTGERHYIHLDVSRVKGEHTTAGSCSSGRPPAASLRPGPALRADESEATLTARAAAPHGRDALTVTMERAIEGGFRGVIAAFRFEREDGMEIIRGAQVGIGRDRFQWDLQAGTASLRPAAPFTGSATLGRAADGTRRLTGSLRVPILGGSPLVLTGPRWNVGLRAGSPFD